MWHRLIIPIILAFSPLAHAQCTGPVDILVVGDSQSGATWSKSYLGNFLAECLPGNFILLGRGGTVPQNWLGNGGLDQIETIQRTPINRHQNIGSKELVPLCKKRIDPMLKTFRPTKVLFQFGSNMVESSDDIIRKQIDLLLQTAAQNGVAPHNCYFLTATFEMEVENRRNVPSRNLQTSLRINRLVKESSKDRCQIIDGVELMKNSPFFDGTNQLLQRRIIPGLPGCGGAAVNDNVHICGEAARDMANRVCELIQ